MCVEGAKGASGEYIYAASLNAKGLGVWDGQLKETR